MNPSTIQQVKEALAPLAEKIGEGAEFMYSVYYRQTIIDGIMETVFSVIGMIVTYLLVRAIFKNWKKIYDNDLEVPAIMLGSPVIVGIVILSIVGIINGPKKFANPHFYTIDRIIQSVKDGEVK